MRFRANDDGEPSGSAGKPILGRIESCEITDTLITVVRYFGGTKLGVPGLINAYRTAAEEALKASIIVELEVPVFLKIEAAFDEISQVEQLVRQTSAEVLDRKYSERAGYSIRMGRSQRELSETFLTERINLGSSLQFEWLDNPEDEAGHQPGDD
jgi:putative IMPACT (imprinted ancient) family translation regulator